MYLYNTKKRVSTIRYVEWMSFSHGAFSPQPHHTVVSRDFKSGSRFREAVESWNPKTRWKLGLGWCYSRAEWSNDLLVNEGVCDDYSNGNWWGDGSVSPTQLLNATGFPLSPGTRHRYETETMAHGEQWPSSPWQITVQNG